jgi:Holliday junction resolvasome RuvABC endonuclease subunit
MTKHKRTMRIVAVAPSSRGFGFAVMEENALIDWGTCSVGTTDKNAQSLEKVEPLLETYQPNQLVLFNTEALGSRRAQRIRLLTQEIVDLGKTRKISTKLYARGQVAKAIVGNQAARKYEIAQTLAEVFPEGLKHRLPKKRRAWESEDPRMHIFDAVALALTARIRGRRKSP